MVAFYLIFPSVFVFVMLFAAFAMAALSVPFLVYLVYRLFSSVPSFFRDIKHEYEKQKRRQKTREIVRKNLRYLP